MKELAVKNPEPAVAGEAVKRKRKLMNDFENMVKDMEKDGLVFEGLLEPMNKPGVKQDKKEAVIVPEGEKAPGDRISIFANRFLNSSEKHWREFKGIGWVHDSEMEYFKSNYAQCAISKVWSERSKMLVAANGERVLPHEAQKAKWVQCAVSGHFTAPDDIVKARDGNNKVKSVSKSWVDHNGGFEKCAYSGKEFIPGSCKKIDGSEKYNHVAPCYLSALPEIFAPCSKCNHWFEISHGLSKRPKLGGGYWCERCYGIAIRKTVILKYNDTSFPKAVFTERCNLGYKVGEDGLIYSTGKMQKHKKTRLFGVEVETEMSVTGCKKDHMDRVAMALAVRDAIGEDFAMTKEDGTLVMNGKYSDGDGNGPMYAGFEIVTAPTDMDLQRQRWPRLVDMPGYKNLRSWDSDTCGMHVHISRISLTSLQIGRMIFWMNHPKNQKFVQKVAGRPSCEYYKYKENTKFSDALASESRCDETRRWAINLTNPETVEIRIFRGTVNPRHILRNLEFSDALCDYCYPASRSLQELGDFKAFIAFVSENRKYWPMLTEWFAFHKMIPYTPPSAKADMSKVTIKIDAVAEPEIKADEKMRSLRR